MKFNKPSSASQKRQMSWGRHNRMFAYAPIYELRLSDYAPMGHAWGTLNAVQQQWTLLATVRLREAEMAHEMKMLTDGRDHA